jgi:hypothetical protein
VFQGHAEFFRAFANGQEFFGADAILQFVRVLERRRPRSPKPRSGSSSSVAPLADSGLDELERARESAEAVQSFPFVPTAMQVLLRALRGGAPSGCCSTRPKAARRRDGRASSIWVGSESGAPPTTSRRRSS